MEVCVGWPVAILMVLAVDLGALIRFRWLESRARDYEAFRFPNQDYASIPS